MQVLQLFPTHDVEGQSVLVPHSPLEPQVCWEVPLTQRVSFGVQVAQSLPMQIPGLHAMLLPQLPLELHVCCVVPLRHCVSLGTQVVQAPEMQAAGQVMSMPSVPALSQV